MGAPLCSQVPHLVESLKPVQLPPIAEMSACPHAFGHLVCNFNEELEQADTDNKIWLMFTVMDYLSPT